VENSSCSRLSGRDFDLGIGRAGILWLLTRSTKLRRSRGTSSINRDVMARESSRRLLKMIEGTTCNVLPSGVANT